MSDPQQLRRPSVFGKPLTNMRRLSQLNGPLQEVPDPMVEARRANERRELRGEIDRARGNLVRLQARLEAGDRAPSLPQSIQKIKDRLMKMEQALAPVAESELQRPTEL